MKTEDARHAPREKGDHGTKNMGYGIRDSVKAAAAVLCLVNAALLAILLMSAFDLGGVNESAGVLFDSLLAGL